MSRKNILIAAVVAILVIGFGIVIKNSITGPTGEVALQLAPRDMRLFVDGKAVEANEEDILTLSPGKHTIKGQRTDFIENSITVEVKQNETQDALLLLDPLNAVGQQYLNDHPEESGLYSHKSSAEFDKSVETMTENSPIVSDLPIIDPNWRMDYGASVKHRETDGAIAVYIYAATPEARQNALGWMRLQGYDPSDYEIIFEQP